MGSWLKIHVEGQTIYRNPRATKLQNSNQNSTLSWVNLIGLQELRFQVELNQTKSTYQFFFTIVLIRFQSFSLAFESYSPRWKRVIAQERSRAASGYGIIWGDADRNKQEGIQCGMSQRGLQWRQQGFNRTTDSNKIEVIVLDDQQSRELRRIRTTGLPVYLYDCTVL